MCREANIRREGTQISRPASVNENAELSAFCKRQYERQRYFAFHDGRRGYCTSVYRVSQTYM